MVFNMNTKIISFENKSKNSIKCPICSEKPIYPHSPFCSRRCSQLDLGRWLNEAYVIPTIDVSDEANLDSQISNEDDEFL